MDPRIQKAARMMTYGPLDLRGKNSEKYENTTGNDPPTLRGGVRGCGRWVWSVCSPDSTEEAEEEEGGIVWREGRAESKEAIE